MKLEIFTESKKDSTVRLKLEETFSYGIALRVVDGDGNELFTLARVTQDGVLDLYDLDGTEAEDYGFKVDGDDYIKVTKE